MKNNINAPFIFVTKLFFWLIVGAIILLSITACGSSNEYESNISLEQKILIIDTVGQHFLTDKFDIDQADNEDINVVVYGYTTTNKWRTDTYQSSFSRNSIAMWGKLTTCQNNTSGVLTTQNLTYLTAEWYGTVGASEPSDFLLGDYTTVSNAKLITPPLSSFPNGEYCFSELYLLTSTIKQ